MLAKFNVPAVSVYVPVVVSVKASPNATVPPAPFWVIGPSVLPADVIVAVPEVLAKVDVLPLGLKVIPETKVKLP